MEIKFQFSPVERVSSLNAMFVTGVQGLLNFMTTNSSLLTDPVTQNLINAMPIDPSPRTTSLSSHHMVKSNAFPMPRAVVGNMELKWFVMLIFSTLVASVFALGLWNMYLERQEELAESSYKIEPFVFDLSRNVPSKSGVQSTERESLVTKGGKALSRTKTTFTQGSH